MSAPVPSGAPVGVVDATAPADLTALGDLAAGPPVAAGLVSEVGEPSPAPTQAPAGGFEAWEVSPGLLGFLPVFLIAVACVFLFLSLTRQMRRVTVRQAQRDAEDAAAAAREAEDGTPGPTGPADGTPDPR